MKIMKTHLFQHLLDFIIKNKKILPFFYIFLFLFLSFSC